MTVLRKGEMALYATAFAENRQANNPFFARVAVPLFERT